MKKIFVLILVCLSFRFLFVGNNEDITNKSNSHNLITNTSNSSKERIIYNSGKIKDNKLIIKEYSSNEFTINVNEYKFYKINNYSVNELYIANCGYQEGQLDGLIYIKLIPANSMYVFKTEGISRENHCLEILHFTDDIPHISYVEIEDDLFDIIVLQSQLKIYM